MNNYFFSDIIQKFKLTFRLVKDPRVKTWLKLIPLSCLLYLIVPIDLLIGPIDDAIIIYLGMDLFIDLCPKEVVDEHLNELNLGGASNPDDEVIDVEFTEK